MTRRAIALALALCAACGPAGRIAPSAPAALPAPRTQLADTSPKQRPRMLPAEVYLRAYLMWFGGLAPLDVQARARGRQLFDAWDDYLAALGLPDYRLDLPRQTQSNTLMLAAFGRLGEALCVRAAEHDLHTRATPLDQRVVFAFAPLEHPSLAQFTERFDVLHRGFLGYPVALAPAERAARYFELFRAITDHHASARGKPPLTPEELGWAGVCAALIQHPEAGLY
jgi:hypothetical protein